MKLKSYLRGLGIGIVVTALIMGIATKDGRPLTDAEIREAAAKLGMVDSSSMKLTDLNRGGTKPGQGESVPGAEGVSEPDITQEPGGMPEPGATQDPEGASEPGIAPEPGQATGPDAAQEPAETVDPMADQSPESSAEGETVKITVKSGTGSRAVCNQLAEAGLIENAEAFDQYLIDGGYSKRISAGTFEIPAGASEEEIAKIISRSR